MTGPTGSCFGFQKMNRTYFTRRSSSVAGARDARPVCAHNTRIRPNMTSATAPPPPDTLGLSRCVRPPTTFSIVYLHHSRVRAAISGPAVRRTACCVQRRGSKSGEVGLRRAQIGGAHPYQVPAIGILSTTARPWSVGTRSFALAAPQLLRWPCTPASPLPQSRKPHIWPKWGVLEPISPPRVAPFPPGAIFYPPDDVPGM